MLGRIILVETFKKRNRMIGKIKINNNNNIIIRLWPNYIILFMEFQS